MWDNYHFFLVSSHVITKLLLEKIHHNGISVAIADLMLDVIAVICRSQGVGLNLH